MRRIRAAGPILAAAFTLLPAAAGASDAAMAKLMECMKLKAASPGQQACLKQVESLRAATKAAAAPIKAPKTAAAMAPAAKPTAKTAAPTVIEPPADVKRAAAEVGLAGAPQAKGSSISGVGSGIAVADLKGMDLETAMMAVQSRRAELLEATLRDRIGSVQARNDEIAKLNQQLAQLRSKQPPAGSAEVAALTAKIDALNNDQQMDMLKLQSLSNKRNEAFELMSNFIKKMADNRSAILGNMR